MPIVLNGSGSVTGITAVTGAGLDPITPTSIAATGGSASFSGAAVTFTGVSNISLNGVFSAAYNNYKIVAHTTTQSGTGNMAIRMRASGSDTASGYDGCGSYGGSVSASFNYTGDTKWALFSPGNNGQSVLDGDLIAPFLTTRTALMAAGFDTRNIGFSLAFTQSGSTSFDGLSFYIDSGNMTGTIRIYGYRNS